jgi:hypothetical protein
MALWLMFQVAVAVEVIINFNEYATRKDLLERASTVIDHMRVLHSVNDLFSKTDFLVLDVLEKDLESLKQLKHFKGYYIH